MSTFVIGDIHGCSKALDYLLKAVDLHSHDMIITLGDYVNKGPDSKGVLERLIKLNKTGQLLPLLGNHDIMMLEARSDKKVALDWYVKKGGHKTLVSYGQNDLKAMANIPNAHWNFLEKKCFSWLETENYIFVHANLNPKLPLNKQSQHDLFWKKLANPIPHYSGKTMICGHTSQKSGIPINLGYAICIDTWACGNGWLTALELEKGRIWQANQKGEVRTAWIDDFYTAPIALPANQEVVHAL
ncbi:metallophosphoesterase family protein [Chroococcus sp. FPU101]|uniref:metallophosphoesterase family protein n=1 Tax=Chroococcus sp. FPU101 TaxID=1974212 RepID=UPI001A8DE006|nr:metallophosphoesterase family protein [Chroococcus sp. FPU101]GFE70310.1 metallophosphoesterase [Chroococcus sp. FPU101]